ncbi:unnamed protein product, partial [Prorocentrum cordatum]
RAAVEALSAAHSALDASLRGTESSGAEPAAAAAACDAARLAAAQAEAEETRAGTWIACGAAPGSWRCSATPGCTSSSETDLAESLRRVSAELEGRAKCCVCREEDREVVLNPCMHLALCRACAERVALCPICRREVMSHMHVTIS